MSAPRASETRSPLGASRLIRAWSRELESRQSTDRHLAHVSGPAPGLQNDLSHGRGPQVVILRGNDDSVPGGGGT
jgi:hypothetical protein